MNSVKEDSAWRHSERAAPEAEPFVNQRIALLHLRQGEVGTLSGYCVQRPSSLGPHPWTADPLSRTAVVLGLL